MGTPGKLRAAPWRRRNLPRPTDGGVCGEGARPSAEFPGTRRGWRKRMQGKEGAPDPYPGDVSVVQVCEKVAAVSHAEHWKGQTSGLALAGGVGCLLCPHSQHPSRRENPRPTALTDAPSEAWRLRAPLGSALTPGAAAAPGTGPGRWHRQNTAGVAPGQAGGDPVWVQNTQKETQERPRVRCGPSTPEEGPQAHTCPREPDKGLEPPPMDEVTWSLPELGTRWLRIQDCVGTPSDTQAVWHG